MDRAPWWERLAGWLGWYWPPTRRRFRRAQAEFDATRDGRTD